MDRSDRILVVDDERLNIELAVAFLKEIPSLQITYALSAEQALKGLYQKKVDLILLDINMPGMDGLTLARTLKADRQLANIPIIFLTAQSGIEYISAAYRAGGVDYINKPFNGEEFKIRVKTQLTIHHQWQELQEKQAKLAQLSITDSLTKTYNQRYFHAQFKQLQANQHNFWLAHFYLSSLEKINRVFGFRHADRLLQKTATLIRSHLFSSDLLFHLYGAHFLALLPKQEAQTVEKKLLVITQNISKLLKQSGVHFYSVAHAATNDQGAKAALRRSYNLLLQQIEKGDVTPLLLT